MKKLLILFVIVTVGSLLCACTSSDECAHSYESSVVAPTCAAEGYTKHTCSLCGDTYNDSTTAKAAHTYEESVTAPTCTADGFTTHTCTGCGDSYTDTAVVMRSHRFNGGNCITCGLAADTAEITPDTEWYSAEKSVFTLTTREQLFGFASLVNSGTDFAGQTIHLGADIDLGYAEWTPIGTAEAAFAGTFAGDDYTVSHLKITAKGSYAGFFGYVTGTISHFNIDKASVYADDAYQNISIACAYSQNVISYVNVVGFIDARESSCVGGIAGSTNSSINNCSASVDIVATDKVGGLAGSLGGMISNSVNYGAITAKNYVGGLAGECTVSSEMFTNLENCGNVTAASYAGGIIGSVKASGIAHMDVIKNSGDVTGTEYVGGIYGYISGGAGSVVDKVSSSANIVGDYYVGGLIGRADGVAVTNCSNEGSTVTGNSYLVSGDVFYAYLGGYLGYGYSIENAVNNVPITYIARGIYVGGVAGYLAGNASKCENNAEIKGYHSVGGVVGHSCGSITESSNSANITGHNNVGGIAGSVATAANASFTILNNSGSISGEASLGGVIGSCTPNYTTTFGEIKNSGTVNGTNDVGGIAGTVYTKNIVFTGYTLENTADITGTDHTVGGLFGFVGGNASSVIRDSSSSANIKGLWRVGGLVGCADSVTLKDSTNKGSTVTATEWQINGSDMNVFLGGYVGYGYKVSGLTNDADINYGGLGRYVGGIIGYATGEIHNCTNNGNIASTASNVGGIAGMAINTVASNQTYGTLVNNGAVSGTDVVGGIFGDFYHEAYYGSCGGSTLTTTFSAFKNYGDVSGVNTIGGIVGRIYANNTGDYWCTGHSYNYQKHNTYSYMRIAGTDIVNEGNVSGASVVGEIFGSFTSDGNSALTSYTVLGKISLNGEAREGAYDVGANSNSKLSLSGRMVYTPASPEGDAPVDENTENLTPAE